MGQAMECFSNWLKNIWAKEPIALIVGVIALASLILSIFQTVIIQTESNRYFSGIEFIARLNSQNELLLIQSSGKTQPVSKVSVVAHFQEKGKTEIPPAKTAWFIVAVEPVFDGKKLEERIHKIPEIKVLICEKERIDCSKIDFRKLTIEIPIDGKDTPFKTILFL
ncbi:hypothetical protein [Sneathiella sp.]|uniref:hypothetical protein n=1 Tax=Sneathiella sp. TaxID=1964365 RepID=UPI00356A799D